MPSPAPAPWWCRRRPATRWRWPPRRSTQGASPPSSTRPRAAPTRGHAVELLERALALWRGPAYGEVADLPFARVARLGQLDERRLTAHEALATRRLALGEHARVADDLTTLVDAHPWREELRLAHVLALYRAGRQPDALASYETIPPRPAATSWASIRPAGRPSCTRPSSRRTRRSPRLGPQVPAATGRPGPAGHLGGDPRRSAPGQGGTEPEPESGRAVHRPAARLPVLRTEVVGPRGRAGHDRHGTGRSRTGHPLRPRRRRQDDAGAGRRRAVRRRRPARRCVVSGPVGRRARRRGTGPTSWPTWWGRRWRCGGRPTPRPGDRRAGSPTRARRDHRLVLVLDNCEHVVVRPSSHRRRPAAARRARGHGARHQPRGRWGWPASGSWPSLRSPCPIPATSGRPRSPRGFPRCSCSSHGPGPLGAAARGRRRATAPLLGTLCRRLDGLPLALELAATRVPALGLPAVVTRLGDRFRLLGSGRRGRSRAPPARSRRRPDLELGPAARTPSETGN